MDRKLNEGDYEWMALRYAVDMIDEYWSVQYSEYQKHPELLTEKTLEMRARRETLIAMQDVALAKSRELYFESMK